jgi:hypothetical protein
MVLLPLFLKHGKTYDFPIVIPGCKEIVLHDLKYKNKAGTDLITSCRLHVNGKVIKYVKSEDCSKTYYIEGIKNKNSQLRIETSDSMKFSLEISCEDFSVCHCKEHNFQLNISAICQ